MTWHYELDAENGRIRLRFEADDGTVYGPTDVPWPNAPTTTTEGDGWVTEPDVQAEAGRACTDLHTDVGVDVALMAVRDLAAGNVVEGTP